VPITFGLPIGTHTIYAASRPTVESEEVAQAVLWLLKDRLEQPPEETLLSVVDYPENCRRDEQLMAVAVSKTVVKSYIDIIEQAGLEIGAIDVSELLIGELMNLMPGAEQGLALIAEHSKGVIILVYRSGNLYLFRNLAGIRDLTSCLPSESNKASADQLMLEIQRTLDYYDSQMRQPPLAGIVVAPSLANLSPLVEYLDANLAVNIELLDLNLLLNLSEPLSPAEQADCILSASAAFRSELVS
jgi:MSHA biogenesis protein MshI